jgi:hypothetical protein
MLSRCWRKVLRDRVRADDEARFGLLTWCDGDRLPSPGGAWGQHHRMRAVAVPNVAEERQGNRVLLQTVAHDKRGAEERNNVRRRPRRARR